MNHYLLVLEKYAVFEGRASREEYWYFCFFHMLFGLSISVIVLLAKINPIIPQLYNLAVLLPAIGVSIRRMHDVNKSGWYSLIPLYNIILCCTKGTEGENDYGPDPNQEYFEEDYDEVDESN